MVDYANLGTDPNLVCIIFNHCLGWQTVMRKDQKQQFEAHRKSEM